MPLPAADQSGQQNRSAPIAPQPDVANREPHLWSASSRQSFGADDFVQDGAPEENLNSPIDADACGGLSAEMLANIEITFGPVNIIPCSLRLPGIDGCEEG